MIEVAIMLEGQNGLNWKRWQRIASAVEACGYKGLYRSDHYTNANPPDHDSLECWTSLTWLASHTSHIEFGPLVSPVSFRNPTMLSRMATAVDDLSGGRLTLGVGAGWQEREHHNYGWELLSMKERFVRLEEALEVITKLMKNDAPVDFSGKYYQLHNAMLLPRPNRTGGPPIMVGGSGRTKTLPLAARYAQEWNAPFLDFEEVAQLNSELDDLLRQQGRLPQEVRRSLAVGCVYGKNQDEVQEKVARRTHGQRNADELRQRGVVVGIAEDIIAQCQLLAKAGVQRIMLQWLDLDDVSGIEHMADGILNKLAE